MYLDQMSSPARADVPRFRQMAVSGSTRYIAGRAGQAGLQLFGVITIVFVILRLSGDPARLLVPEQATAEDIARIRTSLGLDAPILVQYLHYLGQLVRFDFGFSYVQGRSALELILERLPYTVNLALAALLLSMAVGIPVGTARTSGWTGHHPTRRPRHTDYHRGQHRRGMVGPRLRRRLGSPLADGV